MAKGKKTGGKLFGKDQPVPLSPGRPPLSPQAKEFQNLTREKLIALISKASDLTLDELQLVANNQDLPALEAWLISIMIKGIEEGDVDAWEKVVSRAIGKVPDRLEAKTESTLVVGQMTTEELIQAGIQAIEFLNAAPYGDKQ